MQLQVNIKLEQNDTSLNDSQISGEHSPQTRTVSLESE